MESLRFRAPPARRKLSNFRRPRVSLCAYFALVLLLSSAPLTATAQPWRKSSANGQAGTSRAAVTIHKLTERLLYAGTGKIAPLRRGSAAPGAHVAETSFSAVSADDIHTTAESAAAAVPAEILADLPPDAAPRVTSGKVSPRRSQGASANRRGGGRGSSWRAAQMAAESRVAAVVGGERPVVGFPGINQKTLINSGTPPRYNRSMIKVTPPDVFMCVGNGFILHTVNSAMVVYNTKGQQLTAITPHNEFFNALPRNMGTYEGAPKGDAIGDMTCTYDHRSKRFYLATYWTSGGGKNAYDRFGQTRYRADGTTVGTGLLVAASTTPDPTKPWNLFFIPSSNDGKNSNADFRPPLNFPTKRLITFMDYPQIGTDGYGFYLSANHFSYEDDGFFGVSIFAISKVQLSRPANTFILRIAIPTTDNPSVPDYTVWPQKVAADTPFDYTNGGTMYFGYNQDPQMFTTSVLNRIGALLITGTSFLGTKLALSRIQTFYSATTCPEYFTTGYVTQKWSPVPLAWEYGTTIKPIDPSSTDVRGVVVAPVKKQMWLTFMTGSSTSQDQGPYVVIARLRMLLVPTRRWQPFRVVLERFRTVGVKGNGLIQPSIALNRRGRGIMAVSLAGPSYFPSAAYTTVNGETAVGDVVVAAAGGAALDDYSGYMGFADAVRYGDYMTAGIDEQGNAWGAVQYVPGSPRTHWTNWGTYIFKVPL
ncbi:unnamed protein product [Closterium sp. Yama58-4]|nr:unnamed protein product [Closterium sp. Yama58-4]